MYYRYQPIQVYFCGTKYRCTAEAQWAAVFHELALRPHYEPESFLLPSGKYLPDFWLPDSDVYIEIKGKYSGAEPDRYKEFVLQTKRPLLFVAGYPRPNRYLLRYYSPVKGNDTRLLQAQFATHNGTIWIVEDNFGVALAHNAAPKVLPENLNISSAVFAACFEHVKNTFRQEAWKIEASKKFA